MKSEVRADNLLVWQHLLMMYDDVWHVKEGGREREREREKKGRGAADRVRCVLNV